MFHVAEKKISELRRNILHVSAVNIISLTDKLFLGENSMEAIIYRERRAKSYFYEDESGVLTGESNCTFGIALSRAILYRGNEGFAIVQEKYAALKLLSKLLLDIVQLAPYELHYKEEPICSLRLSMSLAPKFTGKIGEHFFELRMHSGNICSLMRDSIQIAKFTKRAKSEFERNIYDVIYLNEEDFELCFLFCVLADILWFRDDAHWYAVRYETGLVPFDNCPDRADWMPPTRH